ncbi:ion transporter [Wenzhouxiangella marina]|uniref:Transporter, cation channel family protein n=1 Tax=Wenzhouxiangella marina TaxID=1579979 RepID=A0A0K0XWI2_9GAMM|nr:ion transporter [Wenzhouxiangella marina]AKS41992.1 Transporter, cation channel family protein [Wenzhouxiangella marina]MBB6086241.1 voltage-gated sodium channel [Wenzhouxiangella marina]
MPAPEEALAPARALHWRERLGHWVEGRGFSRFIIGLIVLNAAILGLETSPTMMERAGAVLAGANAIILGIFVIEILLKLVAFGPRFFRSGWNLFDFFIVGISLVPASGPLEILRALRILRVLRLLSQVPKLRLIIESLMRALPGMGWTALLLILVFYVFAVMGTMMFGEQFPELWGNLARSLFTLFQVMTLESWSTGVARPMFDAYPWVWVYFVPFILVSSFMVLNLFIAIIVTATQSIHADEEEEQRQVLMETLKRIDERLARLEAGRPPAGKGE